MAYHWKHQETYDWAAAKLANRIAQATSSLSTPNEHKEKRFVDVYGPEIVYLDEAATALGSQAANVPTWWESHSARSVQHLAKLIWMHAKTGIALNQAGQ